jgi:small-conductance mechanosensitive channel
MAFLDNFTKELVASGILLFLVVLMRVIITKLVRRFAKSSHRLEQRTNLVIKYIHLLLNILVMITLTLIWGVQTKDIFLVLSSITTIVGVAMVAQWSILSNITSGIILFFAFPFKIGDVILIHDKDYPEEGTIEDIGAFHVTMKSKEGEVVIFPNNLFFQKGISIIKKPAIPKEDFTD